MTATTIGKYRLVGQLGRGTTGIVYKAVDESLNREVAIKILNPDLAETEIMQRFRAEALTLAKLNHPEIATIYELVRSQSDLLMVMELVRGETLEKLSARLGPLESHRAAYLVDRILGALEHAHRAGIVHRDIKPANVMVTDLGGIKIMDFGIARVRNADHVTPDGYLLGTPAYIAPEQILGQEVDARADLYSVGVVFYRLLTGALPFKADTAIDMLQRQVSDAPALLDLQDRGLPAWSEGIIQRALAKDPGERFQTAQQFRESLGRATGMVESDLARAFAVQACEGAEVSQSGLSITLAIPRAQIARVGDVKFNEIVDAGRLPRAATAMLARARTAFAASGPTRGTSYPYSSRAGVMLGLLASSMALLVYLTQPIPAATSIVPAVPIPLPSRAAGLRPTAAEPNGVAKPAAAPKPQPVQQPSRSAKVATKLLTSAKPVRVAAPVAAAKLPPLIFKTKALVSRGTKHREHDARLVLADGRVNVTTGDDDDAQQLLHSVPYGRVISINYSHGRDPMWNSPDGPVRIARAGGGPLSKLGISIKRHWISLRTNTDDAFIVLRSGDELVRPVLQALEERTGRTAHLVAARDLGK